MNNIDASFIKDIDADPKFLEEMTNRMQDRVAELVEDFAFQIMTDYCDAPQNDTEEEMLADMILAPLEKRIWGQIALELMRRQLA